MTGITSALISFVFIGGFFQMLVECVETERTLECYECQYWNVENETLIQDFPYHRNLVNASNCQNPGKSKEPSQAKTKKLHGNYTYYCATRRITFFSVGRIEKVREESQLIERYITTKEAESIEFSKWKMYVYHQTVGNETQKWILKFKNSYCDQNRNGAAQVDFLNRSFITAVLIVFCHAIFMYTVR